MYTKTALLFLAASSASAAVFAERASSFGVVARDFAQGWSLQASSAPSGASSCGNGAYCPSSLHCNTAANNEVAACCSSSSDCRGAVEGAPVCADSAWNLWVGYDNNGFCCETGLVGVYDISKSVAGSCVASGDVGALRTAVLTSTGSGAAATTAAAAASSTSSSASAASITSAAASSSTASVASSASSASVKSTASAKSSSESAASSASVTSASAASSAASSTASSTSSSASAAASSNSGEKLGMGLGMMLPALLAVVVL